MKRLGVWVVYAVDIGWHRIYPLVYYGVEWRVEVDWTGLPRSGLVRGERGC
jgi:hypothetical protein